MQHASIFRHMSNQIIFFMSLSLPVPRNTRNQACLAYFHEQSKGSVGGALGSSVRAAVRALAFHQCGPGSIPGSEVIRGLSVLVLYAALRGFFPGYSDFPLSPKTNL